ncbi:MAG TPA: MBL fold metallo-hydrolase [Candidatus Limiplasma sp.]|nr:MBL fold metallo-hydrolase [Candidatus Limiplasma sp.]
MILRYYGHALFTNTLNSGKTILTDPYGRFCRYPRRDLKADIVTISHHHYDHDALEMVAGRPIVIDEAGYNLPADEVIITGISTYHDNHQGTRRGKNIIFTYEAEGLRIAHMGDLGHLPDEAQQTAIGQLDIMMIPVGGTYTLNAQRAYQCVELLKPRVTIPMHYQTRFSEDLGIAKETEFVQLMGTCPEPVMQCEVSKDTIGALPRLLLMDIQE